MPLAETSGITVGGTFKDEYGLVYVIYVVGLNKTSFRSILRIDARIPNDLTNQNIICNTTNHVCSYENLKIKQSFFFLKFYIYTVFE